METLFIAMAWVLGIGLSLVTLGAISWVTVVKLVTWMERQG